MAKQCLISPLLVQCCITVLYIGGASVASLLAQCWINLSELDNSFTYMHYLKKDCMETVLNNVELCCITVLLTELDYSIIIIFPTTLNISKECKQC